MMILTRCAALAICATLAFAMTATAQAQSVPDYETDNKINASGKPKGWADKQNKLDPNMKKLVEYYSNMS